MEKVEKVFTLGPQKVYFLYIFFIYFLFIIYLFIFVHVHVFVCVISYVFYKSYYIYIFLPCAALHMLVLLWILCFSGSRVGHAWKNFHPPEKINVRVVAGWGRGG